MKEFYANCRGAQIIELIAVEVNEGEGTPDDPINRVLYLYKKDGTFVAKTNDIKERKFYEGDFMIF
jgi:hypothetical protein